MTRNLEAVFCILKNKLNLPSELCKLWVFLVGESTELHV